MPIYWNGVMNAELYDVTDEGLDPSIVWKEGTEFFLFIYLSQSGEKL